MRMPSTRPPDDAAPGRVVSLPASSAALSLRLMSRPGRRRSAWTKKSPTNASDMEFSREYRALRDIYAPDNKGCGRSVQRHYNYANPATMRVPQWSMSTSC